MSRNMVLVVSLITLLIAAFLFAYLSFPPYQIAVIVGWVLLTCILLGISRRRSASLAQGGKPKKPEPYTIRQSISGLDMEWRDRQRYDHKSDEKYL